MTKNNTEYYLEKTENKLEKFLTKRELNLDALLHTHFSRLYGWIPPPTLMIAFLDWLAKFYSSPEKWFDLMQEVHKLSAKLLNYTNTCCKSNCKCEKCIEVRPTDHRFQNELWDIAFPFNLYSQLFLFNEKIWDEATTNVNGVSKHHANIVNFSMRQLLDIFSPSNFTLTNPVVIEASYKQAGINFINGWLNFVEDAKRYITKQHPVGTEQYQVGKNIAITPGKVIYRNQLIELYNGWRNSIHFIG